MNVWIAGMPGSGKSTVGRLLAERLGREFVDADEAVEAREGRAIAAIIEEEGEAEFRRIEAEVVGGLAARDGLVVACGGGAVLDEANREAMRRSGTVVFLRAPLEVLAARIEGSEPRPLLARGRDLGELWAERAPLYEQTADHVADATGPASEVAARVAEALG